MRRDIFWVSFVAGIDYHYLVQPLSHVLIGMCSAQTYCVSCETKKAKAMQGMFNYICFGLTVPELI